MNPWQKRAIQKAIQSDPYYRFRSLAEVTIAAELGICIDVNQAHLDDWLRLPGISIHQARQLVQLVAQGVQFHSLEDLAHALGQPPQRLQPLGAILRFCYYPRLGAEAPQRLDPNRLTAQDLRAIPGDPMAKDRLLQERQNGPYQDWGDLQQRLHLTGEQLAQWLPYFRF